MIVVVVVVPLSPPRKIKRAGERGWEIKGGWKQRSEVFCPLSFSSTYLLCVCVYICIINIRFRSVFG